MIKDKAKRFFIILSFLFIILSLPTITIHASSQNAILFEESSSADFGVFKDIIYNAREDIEDELKSKYGENNVRISYEVLTPYLSLANVNQTTLRDYYNNLGDKKHDLDRNHVITDKDKIGLEEGVCQPTAVSMALEYMVRREKISYTPKLNSNSLDINNIFYDVVKAYIENDWRGGAAISGKCYQALNSYFQNNNINYEASYY